MRTIRDQSRCVCATLIILLGFAYGPTHAQTGGEESAISVGRATAAKGPATLEQTEVPSDHGVVYVDDFLEPCVEDKDAAPCIEAAINSCAPPGVLDDRQGCRVVLPRGRTSIKTTIDFGAGTWATARAGFTLQGHAAGLETHEATSPAKRAGTVLEWAGDPNGTMIRVDGALSFRFQDFMLDGDWDDFGGEAGAGVGIEFVGSNQSPVGGPPVHSGLVENVHITDMLGSPGIGVWMHGITAPPYQTDCGSVHHDQVDEIKFDRVEIRNVGECARQTSVQSFLNTWTGSTCALFNHYGFNVLAGSFTLQDTFIGQKPTDDQPAGTGPLAGVYLGRCAAYTTISENHFEIYSGYGIETEEGADGSGAGFAITLQGNLMKMSEGGGPDKGIMRIYRSGRLSLLGNNFQVDNPTLTGTIALLTRAGAGSLDVFSAGNAYKYGHVPVVFNAPSGVNLVAMDSLLRQANAMNVQSTVDFFRTGIYFPGDESITWGDGVNDRIALRFGSNELTFLDAQTAEPLAGLVQGGGDSGRFVARSLGVGGPYYNDYLCLSKDAAAGRIFADGDCNRQKGADEEYVGLDTLDGDVTSTRSGATNLVTIKDGAVKPANLNTSSAGSAGQCLSSLGPGSTSMTWKDCPTGLINPSETDATNSPVNGQVLTKGVGDKFTWTGLPAATVALPTDITLLAEGATLAWSNMPAVTTEIFGSAARRVKFDLTNVGQFRIAAVQVVVGYLGAKLRLQYSTDQSNWTDLENSGTGADLPLQDVTTGPILTVGGWGTVKPAAKSAGDVFLRLVGFSGNDNKDPSWATIRLQLKP